MKKCPVLKPIEKTRDGDRDETETAENRSREASSLLKVNK